MLKISIFLLTFIVSLSAQQKPAVSEIEYEIKNDTLLIVSYLLNADSSESLPIAAAVKCRTDSSFVVPIKTTSGDIEDDITAGKKSFTWNFKADAPELVKGEIGRMGIRTDLEYMLLTGQYYIDVIIEETGVPWYYYAAGGGAAVIIGAIFLTGGDDTETVTPDSNFPLPPGTR